MAFTLAITGKGGVGKTTLAALAVRWLTEHQVTPVLAVDADPNTCLDILLGMKLAATVGGVREEAKRIAQADSAGGLSKQELLDLKIQEALCEGDAFDLIAMGRPEGPGCYCYANNVLRGVLGRLAEKHAAVVIDNEAGLENLSRRTVQRADWLLFASDPSLRGLATARRLYDLASEMDISASNLGLIVNRTPDGAVSARAGQLFANTPIEILGGLPEDNALAAQDVRGASVFDLPRDNAVYSAAGKIFSKIAAKITAGKGQETHA
jgi:CO dehydrogenase maturation factor